MEEYKSQLICLEISFLYNILLTTFNDCLYWIMIFDPIPFLYVHSKNTIFAINFDEFYISYIHKSPEICLQTYQLRTLAMYDRVIITHNHNFNWNVLNVLICYLPHKPQATGTVKALLVNSKDLMPLSNLYDTHSYHKDCFPDVTYSIVNEARGVNELILFEWLRWAGAKSLDGDLNLLGKARHHWLKRRT